ncbi:histidine kinase [Streptomyces sp. NPDC001817]|uniref:sensor histidine kinase n=1 Tax=Streptomyces sp. NPDC001817 TaxID=3154398 RepID=UPI003330E08F
MTSTEKRPTAPTGPFWDEVVRPVLTIVAITLTIAQWPSRRILLPALALPLFVLASMGAVGSLFPRPRLSSRQQLATTTASMLSASMLLPLVHATDAASLLPYIAASTAGRKLGSPRAAIGVAVTGSLVATGATWLVQLRVPDAPQWPWWALLSVGLPVYIGMSTRYRLDALRSAEHAAEEAQRARESEAREAALIERGRIAREIHDVLGHSLSGIAMQLDMADALHEGGREEEATAAVRRARALAVDSIGETRRAVHALRTGTLPLPDTLRQLAERHGVDFAITGAGGKSDAIGAEATHTVVRAAQEALTNAAKYAPGAERSMRLALTSDRVTLTVRNGPATGPRRGELADGTGVGLVGMRERAALLGGTLQAEPTREGGWTVELELPR